MCFVKPTTGDVLGVLVNEATCAWGCGIYTSGWVSYLVDVGCSRKRLTTVLPSIDF